MSLYAREPMLTVVQGVCVFHRTIMNGRFHCRLSKFLLGFATGLPVRGHDTVLAILIPQVTQLKNWNIRVLYLMMEMTHDFMPAEGSNLDSPP